MTDFDPNWTPGAAMEQRRCWTCRFFQNQIGEIGSCHWWLMTDAAVPSWLDPVLNTQQRGFVSCNFGSKCPAWERRKDG